MSLQHVQPRIPPSSIPPHRPTPTQPPRIPTSPWHLDVSLALDLEGLGRPLLLQGVELLLSQELGARVHRQLPRVLQVGAGTPAWVHGGPQ